MILRQRALWILATITLLSCGRPAENTAVVAAQKPDPIARALAAKPHRLGVVFLPQLSGCASCDQMVSAVISEWQAAPDAEMVVVTVIPEHALTNEPWFPGTTVRLKGADYLKYRGNVPLPRVEIWRGDGVLLMARSVPNNGLQAELLTEEMLAARSYTAPAAVASQ